ncbi:MAG: hypothetical protein ACTSUD_13455 [Alphaproteobacteria bacterium]
MKKSAGIGERLEQVIDHIRAAHAMVLGGRSVELSGFQERVEAVCGDIEKLPQGKRSPYEMPVVSLIDELNKLETELKSQHANLSKGLKAISNRHNASSAYGRAAQTEDGR